MDKEPQVSLPEREATAPTPSTRFYGFRVEPVEQQLSRYDKNVVDTGEYLLGGRELLVKEIQRQEPAD